jgi:hypothetical protein
MGVGSRRRSSKAIRLLAAVLASIAVAGSVVAPSASAKTCGSGYVHAVIDRQQKCLRAGEFCARRDDSQYRHYGFRCIRYYRNVHRYRLTHA